MSGILPGKVRRRRTKGSLEPRICWALRRERALLGQLMGASILADLGSIEPKKVLEAIDDLAKGLGPSSLFVYTALSLETWLSARSGRCMITDALTGRVEERYARQQQVGERVHAQQPA